MLSFDYFTSMRGKKLKVVCFKTAIWRTLTHLQPRVVNARYLLSVVLDGERCSRLANHGLSANLMIARQENVQGSRAHFPTLVKLFALWWQMLVQTPDITVRSQIAKASAHCRRPDCGCFFFLRSYAVDICAVRSFSCLLTLWRTPTRHRSTSLELQLPIPGSCCRRPRLICCQTLDRSFSQNECL